MSAVPKRSRASADDGSCPGDSRDRKPASEKYVGGPWRYERIEGVGHDIPVAAPDRLNELLLDFLA